MKYFAILAALISTVTAVAFPENSSNAPAARLALSMSCLTNSSLRLTEEKPGVWALEIEDHAKHTRFIRYIHPNIAQTLASGRYGELNRKSVNQDGLSIVFGYEHGFLFVVFMDGIRTITSAGGCEQRIG